MSTDILSFGAHPPGYNDVETCDCISLPPGIFLQGYTNTRTVIFPRQLNRCANGNAIKGNGAVRSIGVVLA